MSNPNQNGEGAGRTVTVSITQHVRPGREQDFEAFLQGVSEAASDFPGFVGVRVIRPVRGDSRYRILLRFERESDIRRWMESDVRKIWLARGEELADEPPQYADITGTAQAQPLALALSPLHQYVRSSISGIGLLLLGALVALVFANSPWSGDYERFWANELTIGIERFSITESFRHWVNDGLMTLFFFIVGLEIKREVLVGELRYPRQAAFPIAAAIGGAIVPALLFAALNLGGAGIDGWGVPIGTDTAFSLGIISLFANRVRPMLLVFLTAFAIIDDILAVLVIAVFYTDDLSWAALALAGVLMLALIVANRAGIHRWPVYALLGIGVWLAIFESGVHGTLAGVLVAMTVPARSWINPREFIGRGRRILDDFELASHAPGSMLSNEPQQEATQALIELSEQVEAPLTHFEHRLNPWVTFGVVPLFAFANSGIPILDDAGEALVSPVTWGVIAGLIVGKPLGITAFAWLAVRGGIARMPAILTWRQIFGVAWLGGIGFTMSLFIAELAFGDGPVADEARIGVLVGSVIAGGVGYLVLDRLLPAPGDEIEV